jgi:hypothetical protein
MCGTRAAVNLDIDSLHGDELKVRVGSLEAGLVGQHICLLGGDSDDMRCGCVHTRRTQRACVLLLL